MAHDPNQFHDTNHEHETFEEEIRDKRYDNGSNSRIWMWALLLPVFFLLGWVTNDYLKGTNLLILNRPEAGVGGGPITPTAFPTLTPMPTQTTGEITPSPTISETTDESVNLDEVRNRVQNFFENQNQQ